MENSYKKIKSNRQDFEQQYVAQGWDNLREIQQVSRYSLICSYVKYIGRPVSLLDVGCGEGLLLNCLTRDSIDKYCGLDISSVALNNVRLSSKNDELVCSTIEEYSTQDMFDVIVFNEVLYYIYHPAKHLDRYKYFLKQDGVFIISMHKKANYFSYNNRCIRSVWKHIYRQRWNIIDEVRMTNLKRKLNWRLALVMPHVVLKNEQG